MRFVDLSMVLNNNSHYAPWWGRNKVVRQGHKLGRLAIFLLFRLSPKYLTSGLGWANDIIKLSTHGTTHLDAPWHYNTALRKIAEGILTETRAIIQSNHVIRINWNQVLPNWGVAGGTAKKLTTRP